MKESEYQAKLIKKLKTLFPGCMVFKNDPNYIQGIPDLLILYGKKWAALEVKRSIMSPHRPNQDYYVARMRSMSYASFIFPENEKEVFDELYKAFGKTKWGSRVSRS